MWLGSTLRSIRLNGMRRPQPSNSSFRIALWASALAHLLLLIGLDALAPWLRSLDENSSEELKNLASVEEPPLDMSLVYVEVNPETAVEEAPEDAAYYSAQNSEAADMADQTEEQPSIDGTQSEVLRVMENPSSEATEGAQATSPVMAQDSVASVGQPDAEPEKVSDPSEVGGWDLEERDNATTQAVIRDQEEDEAKSLQAALGDEKGEKTPSPRRPPRTLAEAQMRQASLESELTRQEGGSEKFSMDSSLSSRSTLYGAYDAIMFRVIEKHWRNILRSSTARGLGRVQLKFRLHSDGRISRLVISKHDTPSILALYCRRAIQETAPHPPWPEEMHKEVGQDFRDLELNFHYH